MSRALRHVELPRQATPAAFPRIASPHSPRTAPIRVNDRNPWDKAVQRLGRQGFTTAVIVRQFDGRLTPSQVNYRRGALNAGMAFRRGEHPDAQLILSKLDKLLNATKALKVFLKARAG